MTITITLWTVVALIFIWWLCTATKDNYDWLDEAEERRREIER